MGSKTVEYANSLLLLIFNGVSYPGIAIADSGIPNLYASLHTSNPGVNGNQSVAEVTYSNYQRIAIPRSPSSGWTVIDNVATLTLPITFPQVFYGNEVATYFGIGLSATGTGHLMYATLINPPITISVNIIPQLTTGAISEI